MKMHSLAGRLISAVLLLELLCALVLAGTSVLHERRVRTHSFDEELRSRARDLLDAVDEDDVHPGQLALRAGPLTTRSHDIFLVIDDETHGQVLGCSIPCPPSPPSPVPGPRSSTPLRVNGVPFHFVAVHGLRAADSEDHGHDVLHHVSVYLGASTAPVQRQIMEAVRFYSLTAVLLLTVTGLGMTWFLRRALLPVRELAAEAGKISAQQWTFSPPASARSTRELAPLAQAMESALARLQQSFRQQERFTSDAAHELKTDVAIVKSSLQLLSMRPRTPAEYEDGIRRCLEDCIRMEGLVSEMLLFASAKHTDSAHAAPAPLELRAALQSLVQRFTPLATNRNITIRWNPPHHDVFAVISPRALEILASNLLDNALQHAPPSSTVITSLFATSHTIGISFTDSGKGIPSDVLPHVFDPFFRGDPSRDRRTGGTGLGLSISKAICETAGGSLSITSTPGSGTTATVSLPRADIAEPPQLT